MMNWNCEEGYLGTEAKTDYKMMAKELKSIVEDRNIEIETLRKHIEHLKIRLVDNFSSEEDYQKLKDENFVLKNELGRIKDTIVDIALGGIQ